MLPGDRVGVVHRKGAEGITRGGELSKTPILFLINRFDPMTPLGNAHEMAKGYPGSVVLGQNARGHGALLNMAPAQLLWIL
jgi:hypothetical protein